MKHISTTFMYIILNAFEADNIYKNPPPKVISPIFFSIFISLWGSTHNYVDCWSAHRPSCPRQLQTCARLVQGWVASAGCPPNKNHGYAGECLLWYSPFLVYMLYRMTVCTGGAYIWLVFIRSGASSRHLKSRWPYPDDRSYRCRGRGFHWRRLLPMTSYRLCSRGLTGAAWERVSQRTYNWWRGPSCQRTTWNGACTAESLGRVSPAWLYRVQCSNENECYPFAVTGLCGTPWLCRTRYARNLQRKKLFHHTVLLSITFSNYLKVGVMWGRSNFAEHRLKYGL